MSDNKTSQFDRPLVYKLAVELQPLKEKIAAKYGPDAAAIWEKEALAVHGVGEKLSLRNKKIREQEEQSPDNTSGLAMQAGLEHILGKERLESVVKLHKPVARSNRLRSFAGNVISFVLRRMVFPAAQGLMRLSVWLDK